jgi:hypothetical protein
MWYLKDKNHIVWEERTYKFEIVGILLLYQLWDREDKLGFYVTQIK